jgi:hypothetical protein
VGYGEVRRYEIHGDHFWTLNHRDRSWTFGAEDAEILLRELPRIANDCEAIGLKESAGFIRRFVMRLRDGLNELPVIREKCADLKALLRSEMDSNLFFWVPGDRASFYGKTGRDVLGEDCVNRFAKLDIANETEQATKCFAFGQYTACAFHLMRVCEAGVHAFGTAIGFKWGINPNWGKMFDEFDKQMGAYERNPNSPTGAWISHKDYLKETAGNLRAVKNAWRNNNMHLDKTYDESQAKHLLIVVPAFMKQLASKIDEDGNFI